ncbi:MAG: ATP synthase F1 subunit epsilon [Actinobacteria bacterium]|nr:ATP synthase F1 subunit epsilon [Actinomycetota bacterium]
MPDNKIQVSFLTPEESIFKGETDSLVVPAVSGALGILPGHMPIVARLSIGIVKIGKGGDARYFGIQRGYIEFLFNKVSILTGRAVETEYGERDQVIQKLKEKYDILQEVTEETKKIARAMADIKSLED